MNFDLLTTELTRDEGMRLTVYDDATGKPLRPGDTLKGHPTIGIGRALDTHGISQQEAYALLHNDIFSITDELYRRIPSAEKLNEVRQMVLACMAFQMGVEGLLGFHDTLAAVGRGDYGIAAAGMLDSKWAKQTPARAERLAEMMKTGEVAD